MSESDWEDGGRRWPLGLACQEGHVRGHGTGAGPPRTRWCRKSHGRGQLVRIMVWTKARRWEVQKSRSALVRRAKDPTAGVKGKRQRGSLGPHGVDLEFLFSSCFMHKHEHRSMSSCTHTRAFSLVRHDTPSLFPPACSFKITLYTGYPFLLLMIFNHSV